MKTRKRGSLLRMMLAVAAIYLMCAGVNVLGAAENVWKFGNQLDNANAKAVYAALEAVDDLKEYYYVSDEACNGISVTMPVPYACGTVDTYEGSQGILQAQQDAQRAADAYRMDHAEAYWVYYFRIGYSLEVERNGNVILKNIQLFPMKYYESIFADMSETEAELNRLNNAVASKSSRYAKVKAAHDQVAKLVVYNEKNPDAGFSHTITGGLLSKYSHLGVCECYAKLFRMICLANDIPCVLVSGDYQGKDHMWNYVQMDDGNWYLVDVTLDDQNIGLCYDYFLAGSNTRGFDGKVKQEYAPSGWFNDMILYREFELPPLSKDAYDNQHDHVFDKGKIILEPTCVKNGIKKYTCTVEGCNEEKTEDIKCTGHVKGKLKTVIQKKCGVDGRQEQYCTKCNKLLAVAVLKAQPHKAGKWTVIQAATNKKAGKQVQKCTHCKATLKTKSIPKTFVELNISGTLPLQTKKSTSALKIASQSSGDSVVKWTSSNTKVVKVNAKTGKLTAQKKTGTAVITVTMKSGATDSVNVKVQSGKVKTQKLTVSKTAVTLKVKGSYTLTTVRTPVTTAEKVTFSTSDKKVATVNSKGKITAKKAGSATITAKSGSKRVKIKVTVIK